ncbi:MAG: hypothetical protein M3H12_02645 [Chromatiales bacterium]|nr:hypothetical protein [Gammaproteobacteria bacterium]
MRPSKIRQGAEIIVSPEFGGGKPVHAFYMKRVPARGRGRPAVNYLRFPSYAGLNGPDDDGTCTMSDYDLSRRGKVIGDKR